MRNAEGKVVRFISQIEDITRHKEHERQLAERAAQLELALEAVRGGFWQMDILSGKVNVNDGAHANLTPLLAGKLDLNVAEYRLDIIHGDGCAAIVGFCATVTASR